MGSSGSGGRVRRLGTKERTEVAMGEYGVGVVRAAARGIQGARVYNKRQGLKCSLEMLEGTRKSGGRWFFIPAELKYVFPPAG